MDSLFHRVHFVVVVLVVVVVIVILIKTPSFVQILHIIILILWITPFVCFLLVRCLYGVLQTQPLNGQLSIPEMIL
jgi:hypothetical protein